MGILNWVKHICGPDVQEEILDALNSFFHQIGKPETVEKIMGTAYGRMI